MRGKDLFGPYVSSLFDYHTYYSTSLGVYYTYDTLEICCHILLYVLIRTVYSNYNSNHRLACSSTKQLAVWYFLYSANIINLTSYYWFDLFMSMLELNPSGVLNASFMINYIGKYNHFNEYSRLYNMIVIDMAANIVSEQETIINTLELDTQYPFAAFVYCYFTNLVTIILRIIKIAVIAVAMPFMDQRVNLVLYLYILCSLYRTIKLVKHVKKNIDLSINDNSTRYTF